jgi:hypothetical protein
MVDVTMTPPRDGGPPGDEQLVARVIPLRRRGEAGERTLLAPTSPPATAFGPSDEPAEPTSSAVADRDMWEDRASRLRLREPVVAGGHSSSVRLPAAHARRSTRRRGVSRVAFGIAALVAMVVAVVVISSNGSPRVAGSPAHVVDSKSASSAANVSAAKTAARAAAAQATLRAAHKRATATTARKRASRIARAHKVALARARATRAKQRARQLVRQPTSEGSTTSTATPAVTEPAVATSSPVVTHPKSSAPKRGSASAGGCATAAPGQLGC